MFTTIISVDDLQTQLDKGEEMGLFDCSFDLTNPNGGMTVYHTGHIPGAFHLDLDGDLSSPPTGSNGRHPLPSPDILAAKLRTCGLRQGQQVVAYDRSGGAFAARLWWLLRWMGHDAVAVLDGGWQEWVTAHGRVEAGNALVPQTGNFTPHLSEGATVSANDLLANLSAAVYCIIDARSPERFRGEPNPMDPVSGHIPGAYNRFYQKNLDTDGKWKNPSQLREEFMAVMGEGATGKVVLQCGSGVTACHNALAMTCAGFSDYLLYPGSWSEWISDVSRPITVE